MISSESKVERSILTTEEIYTHFLTRYEMDLLKCILSIVAFIYMAVPNTAVPLPLCLVPDNLEEMLKNYGTDLDATVPNNTANGDIPSELRTDEDISLFHGNNTCPASMGEILAGPETTLDVRSTCPYFYAVNTDEHRYPKNIVHARCKCTKCIDNDKNVCEPVYQKVNVLKKTGKLSGSNTCKYEKFQYPVQVGCVCAKQRQFTSTPSAADDGASADDGGPPPM